MKGKRVELTAQIEEWIAASVGEIDTSKIAVYEAVAASTRPVSQKNSIYDGAIMALGLLNEMAEFVNDGGVVPLQVMHKTYGELPEGKVFRASVEEHNDGFSSDLITLFYLPLASEKLVNDIDLGLIDEVSVGALSKKAMCSECGYDFFDFSQDDADWNLFTRTCDEGHKIGVDGVHLNLAGLANWRELSLVGKGASNQAKIRGSKHQTLSKDERRALAANGEADMSLYYLFCSASEGEADVDMTKLIGELTDAKSGLALAEQARDTAKSEVETLTTKVGELETQLADAKALNEGGDTELQAQLDTANADKEKLTGDVETLKASAETTQEFLIAQAKKAAIAVGKPDQEFADSAAAIAFMEEAQLNMHQLIPADGASHGKPNDLEASEHTPGNNAFRSRR